MGLKASISDFQLFHSFQPSTIHKKKKKKSNHLHRVTDHSSTPLPHFSSDHSLHSLSLSLYPLATTATTSNQTKSFTFPSLALIRLAPRLHSFKLFTSLFDSLSFSLVSTRWQQQLVGYFKVQIKLRFSLSHVSSSGHES